MRKLNLFLCVILASTGFCADLLEWPFSVSENGTWDVASPRVSFDIATEMQERAAKKALDYGRRSTNEVSVAIKHVPEARLLSVADGVQKIDVGVLHGVVCYVDEWSRRKVLISLFAGLTNRIHAIGCAPTNAVPAEVSHLFSIIPTSPEKSVTGESREVARPRDVYLAEVSYSPFSDVNGLSPGRNDAAKNDLWLKTSVYIADNHFLVCEVDVYDWDSNGPLRNAGIWAFRCDTCEPILAASTKRTVEKMKERIDELPTLYADVCVDSRRSIRFYIACGGREGRVILDSMHIVNLFRAIKADGVLPDHDCAR